MSDYTPPVQGTGLKASIQRVGGYLAGMVMPNIGAFIAWGLITALFLNTGWIPNEHLAQLIDPIVGTLLPVLIGYTGGRMVHEQRGAVAGAVATMGIVIGAGPEHKMFLGAMIIGPLAAYVVKLFDRLIQDRIKPGFEMLVDNLSAGIISAGMAVLGMLGIAPVVSWLSEQAETGVGWLVNHDLLPVASLIVEPAKVLFLNNAINHGVLGPLGINEAADTGQSILFMIESNPGPGLGLLMAFMFFGPRRLRPSVPAAAAIQFLGGIHEIYFPYILMKPRLILATMAGGLSGVATFMVTGAGLVATPSPGSIFAYLTVLPRGSWFGVLAGIVIAAVVSFVVAAALLGFGRPARKEAEQEAAAASDDREPAKGTDGSEPDEPAAAAETATTTPKE